MRGQRGWCSCWWPKARSLIFPTHRGGRCDNLAAARVQEHLHGLKAGLCIGRAGERSGHDQAGQISDGRPGHGGCIKTCNTEIRGAGTSLVE